MNSGSKQTNLRPLAGRGQLFRVSQFLYIIEGRSFTIQVQESSDGLLTAYADSTSDPHETLLPVSGEQLDKVLESMTSAIDKKVCTW